MRWHAAQSGAMAQPWVGVFGPLFGGLVAAVILARRGHFVFGVHDQDFRDMLANAWRHGGSEGVASTLGARLRDGFSTALPLTNRSSRAPFRYDDFQHCGGEVDDAVPEAHRRRRGERVLTQLLQVALPFFLGLFAGHVLRPRSPDSRLAHVLYGLIGITAIWVFIPNPLGLTALVTIPGLILAGVLSGLFDGYRLVRRHFTQTAS